MKNISKILISQPEPDSRSPYFPIEEKYKVQIDFKPFIVVEPVSVKEFRKQRVDLNHFSNVIFTSRNAMDFYFQMMENMRSRISQETKYFCRSEAIALYLQKHIQYRKRKVFYGNGSQKDLEKLISKYKETGAFLVPCSDVRSDILSNFLKENKFKYKECIMYKTVSNDLSDLFIENYNLIAFFSPNGVQSLFDNFKNYKQNNTVIAGFGPITCDKITDMKLRLDIKAPIPEAPSMSAAIDRYLQENSQL